MLRQRVLTALVLIPLAVAAVLWLPSSGFAALLGLVMLAGGMEGVRLAGYPRWPQGVLSLLVLAALLGLLWQVREQTWIAWVLALLAAWWFAVMLALLTGKIGTDAVPRRRPVALLGSALLLAGCWLALTQIHAASDFGPPGVLFLLVLVWVADSAAFFAGRRWGRRKLAPRISPGKTVEGLWGAVLGAVLCALGGSALGLFPGLEPAALLALCVVTTLVSVAGDLWESVAKRRSGEKDSGSLLPGHGGVLDRIDSLIAAAPVFSLGLHALRAAA
jgi:phosphatidate cytidylyltransferase